MLVLMVVPLGQLCLICDVEHEPVPVELYVRYGVHIVCDCLLIVFAVQCLALKGGIGVRIQACCLRTVPEAVVQRPGPSCWGNKGHEVHLIVLKDSLPLVIWETPPW